MPEVARPFKDDPAKQERFELYLKQKYEGGLRTTGFGGASNMSELARARERLDFEAAAEAIEKGHCGKEIKNSILCITEYLAPGGMQFTSGGLQVCFQCGIVLCLWFFFFFSFSVFLSPP